MHGRRPRTARRFSPYDTALRRFAAVQARAALPPRPRFPARGGDQGFVSVESIGWIGIAVAVVAVVGLIVRTKLTAMANALPDALGW